MKTQYQLYQEAEAKSGRFNELMMEMMQTGEMTNDDLAKQIARRPDVYGRFEGFVGKLPE